MTRAVLFDIDGVLIDDQASWDYSVRRASEYVCDMMAGGPGPDAIRHAYAQMSDELWSRYDTVLASLGGDVAIRRHVWAETLRGLNYRVDDDFVNRLVDRYAGWRLAAIQPDPSLALRLERLAQRVGLAVCSNGRSSVQRARLDRVGVLHLFRCVECGQDDGVRKPHPEIFLRCARRLGVRPEECLHVGDDWQLDVLGAARAGMSAVWISHGRRPPSTPVAARVYADVVAFVDEFLDATP